MRPGDKVLHKPFSDLPASMVEVVQVHLNTGKVDIVTSGGGSMRVWLADIAESAERPDPELPKLSSASWKVLGAVVAAGDDGCSDVELGELRSHRGMVIADAVRELVRARLISDSGERRFHGRQMSIVWRTTPRGHAVHVSHLKAVS